MKKVFYAGHGCGFFGWHSVLAAMREFFLFIPLLNMTIKDQVEQQAADIHDVDDSIVLGHSGGANKALEHALMHPSRVRKLILLDPAAVWGSWTPFYMIWLVLMKPLAILWPVLRGKPFDLPDDYKDKLLFNTVSDGMKKQIRPVIDTWSGAVLKEMLIRSFYFKRDWKKLLPNTEIIVVSGDKDETIHWKLAQCIKETLGATIVRLPKAGHMWMLQDDAAKYWETVLRLAEFEMTPVS